MESSKPPQIGADVHFVDDQGKHHAAKVLEVIEEPMPDSTVIRYLANLIVFKRPDPLAMMRGLDDIYPIMVRQDQSGTKHPWTWHFPEG